MSAAVVQDTFMNEKNGETKFRDEIPHVDADEKETNILDRIDEKVSAEKTSEAHSDPKQNPIEWLKSLMPEAVHKVNYHLLNWTQQLAIEEESKRQSLPGKNNSVTKNQFLSFLRDGTLLTKLANRLRPGSVETIYEGEDAKIKENQESNIKMFINFLKESAGLTDDQVFDVKDLQSKGKAGYDGVFNTLMQLAAKAQTTFEQKGIDMDQIVQVASQVVPSNIVQTLLSFFRRARPTQVMSPKKLAKEAEEKEKSDKYAIEKGAEEKIQEKKMETHNAPTESVAIPAN